MAGRKRPAMKPTKSMEQLAWCVGGVVGSSLLMMWLFNFWVLGELENQQQQQVHHQHILPRRRKGPASTSSEPHSPKQRTLGGHHRKASSTTVKSNSDNNNGYEFHYVFSSGCNRLQDWQSYMFFHQIKETGFTGNVTRVASCETDEDAAELRELHNAQISIMSPKFNLHTTPDYTHLVPGKKYNFFNKPFGLRHWLEHGLNLPQNMQQLAKTIVVVMDPDQFLLRPFTQDMTDQDEAWQEDFGFTQVKRGQPMAAGYAFGGAWIHHLKVDELLAIPNMTIQVPKEKSGLSDNKIWNVNYVRQTFAVGPPYVFVIPDMYDIVTTWSDLVIPMYHQLNGGFNSEMYAYCTAAAHLKLPHRISSSFMFSQPADDSKNEAWSTYIDDKGSQEVCATDFHPMPHAMHFCQRYYIGPYFLSKYQIPKTPPDDMFLSCEHPLLQEPPMNVADLYNTSLTPNGEVNQLPRKKDRLRHAFVVCQMLPRLNAAATFYKDHHCAAGEANYSKVFLFETHEVKKQRLARQRGGQNGKGTKSQTTIIGEVQRKERHTTMLLSSRLLNVWPNMAWQLRIMQALAPSWLWSLASLRGQSHSQTFADAVSAGCETRRCNDLDAIIKEPGQLANRDSFLCASSSISMGTKSQRMFSCNRSKVSCYVLYVHSLLTM